MKPDLLSRILQQKEKRQARFQILAANAKLIRVN